MATILELDTCATKSLAVCAHPSTSWVALRLASRLLEFSFHGLPWIIFSCIGIVMASNDKETHLKVNFLLALFLDLVVVVIIKSTVQRPRPQHNSPGDNMVTFDLDKRFSFPSGHTTRAIMCGCLLLHCFDLNLVYQYGVICWAISASVSRIILGRHYVSDVVAGAGIGFLQFYVMIHYLWLDKHYCWQFHTLTRSVFG
ncbi:polyisoprenoid diphosphate/phosphate phosphohydrolase PLPP6-like [Watersipora subatra]|uniref:polyisoprenoid diphosphate/phosphate phosphohydrolase PLPP6-like n=1 Tax=Watersipora subatra TaxID=2589382 RepID=UPI00355B697B